MRYKQDPTTRGIYPAEPRLTAKDLLVAAAEGVVYLFGMAGALVLIVIVFGG